MASSDSGRAHALVLAHKSLSSTQSSQRVLLVGAQVPENAAVVLRSTTADSGGGNNAGVGEAVIEARRALRSVQDVMQSVVQSAQVRELSAQTGAGQLLLWKKSRRCRPLHLRASMHDPSSCLSSCGRTSAQPGDC